MRKLLALIFLLPSVSIASGIYNPGSSGGGGGGSGIVSPGTFTWTNAFGMQASTFVVTSDNVTNALGVVNLGQMANIANANGVQNGNFLYWGTGTSFTNTGLGGVTANQWNQFQNPTQATQSFVRVSTVTHNALYAMQHSITFNNGTGDQQLIQQTIANYYDYAGSSVTLTAWVNSNAATTIAIVDSAGSTVSAAHPADSAWHQLSVTRFLAAGISSLKVQLGNQTHPGTGTVQYYDNVTIVPGDSPVNYIPVPVGIIGVTDGSGASPGQVGEEVRATSSGTSFGASGVWTNIASIVLTAGDWDVTGLCDFQAGGSGSAYLSMGCAVSVNSGNTTTDQHLGDNQMQAVPPIIGVADNSAYIPTYQINVSATTTVYLKGLFNYTSSAGNMTGRISARRMR